LPKIFDFEEVSIGTVEDLIVERDDSDVEGPPPSPSIRERANQKRSRRYTRDLPVPPIRLRPPFHPSGHPTFRDASIYLRSNRIVVCRPYIHDGPN